MSAEWQTFGVMGLPDEGTAYRDWGGNGACQCCVPAGVPFGGRRDGVLGLVVISTTELVLAFNVD